MNTTSPHEVTQLLKAWSEGDRAALEKLIPLVYEELHRLASGYLNRELPGQTLQATALVNEAYLRLVSWEQAQWQNRAHFFGVSAHLMRRILVDAARVRHYEKRGGGLRPVALDETAVIAPERSAELIALDDALQGLAAMDARKEQIVELRYFGGLSEEEVAEVLNISSRTVRREWNSAKAWLYREMSRK